MKIGGSEVETVEAELSGALLHASFHHGADDLRDRGLEAFGGVGGGEFATARGLEREIVEAARARARKGKRLGDLTED